jgi:Dyp-type peroxidase family
MAEKLDVEDIQGLIARGYGRLPHATYLLARIDDPAGAGRLLERLATGVVTSAADSRPTQALNVSFTSAGLLALTGWQRLADGFAEAFVTGMATPYRNRLLGDVGTNDPAGWLWGGPNTDPVHVLLQLFAADAEDLGQFRDAVMADLAQAGVLPFVILPVAELSEREPFGFRDGLSQPVLAGLPSDRRGDIVRDGEFVLGYVNEYGQRTERPLLPPREDPDRLLPRDVDGSADLGRNGSYLVFRQLDQDVQGFDDYLSRAATVAGEVDAVLRDRIAAKLVGRWRGSGAPLTLSPDCDDPSFAAANDFGYHALDPDGMRCPVGAHIRRANPRDSLPPDAGTKASRDVNHRHRLLRRGRAYAVSSGESDDIEQGLYFQCLNTNIARQYEFVQHSWVNDPLFDGLIGVEDPVVGPRVDGPARFDEPALPVRRRYESLPRFVTVRGGAYFFMPGVRALKFLASQATGRHD